MLVSDRYANFCNYRSDILRSDTADNQYRYPINDHINNVISKLRDSSTLWYLRAQRSDDIVQQQQLHKRTRANAPFIGQLANDDWLLFRVVNFPEI